MVRLKVNKGKSSGIRPNDIVGTIAFHANIPGYTIGKIRIEDKFTLVDVPEDLVEQVLKHSGNYRLGKEKLTLTKAKSIVNFIDIAPYSCYLKRRRIPVVCFGSTRWLTDRP
jgi:hypothetical protein